MRILITSAGHDRSTALADHLAQNHEIRLTERTHVETEREFALSALGHDRSTNLLTRGIDAIIHAVEPLPGEDVSSQLDAATRCTYNLLMAAAEEGVQQVILVTALPSVTGPHSLGAARRDIHGRAGEYLLGVERVSIQEAIENRRGRFESLFEVRPAHNPVGPLDVAGCYDEYSDRTQTLDELVDRGYEDGFRQFVDAVLGASGELIEAPPAERLEPTESFSARLASQD